MRYPNHTLLVVEENRVDPFMVWYTAQARNRWNVTQPPDVMEEALYSNPLVEVGTTTPVTHYATVMILRSDQYKGQSLNPPNFADLYEMHALGHNGLPTYQQKLAELGLEPQPQEEP